MHFVKDSEISTSFPQNNDNNNNNVHPDCFQGHPAVRKPKVYRDRKYKETLVNGSHGDKDSSTHRQGYYDSCHSQFQFTALMLVK